MEDEKRIYKEEGETEVKSEQVKGIYETGVKENLVEKELGSDDSGQEMKEDTSKVKNEDYNGEKNQEKCIEGNEIKSKSKQGGKISIEEMLAAMMNQMKSSENNREQDKADIQKSIESIKADSQRNREQDKADSQRNREQDKLDIQKSIESIKIDLIEQIAENNTRIISQMREERLANKKEVKEKIITIEKRQEQVEEKLGNIEDQIITDKNMSVDVKICREGMQDKKFECMVVLEPGILEINSNENLIDNHEIVGEVICDVLPMKLIESNEEEQYVEPMMGEFFQSILINDRVSNIQKDYEKENIVENHDCINVVKPKLRKHKIEYRLKKGLRLRTHKQQTRKIVNMFQKYLTRESTSPWKHKVRYKGRISLNKNRGKFKYKKYNLMLRSGQFEPG